MNPFRISLLSLLLSFWAAVAFIAVPTHSTVAQNKAVKKQDNQLKSALKKKAIKAARKEAKGFKKKGYMVTPGSIPMELSLEQAWMKQLDRDNDGNYQYLWADGNGVAETRTAAELQALETAKLNLAGQLESEIRGIVEANIANSQLNNEDAASITNVLVHSKNIIATNLSRVDPVFKIYRNLPNKNVEVNVKIFYDKSTALYEAKQSVRDQLQKDLDHLKGSLNKILDL